MRPSRQDQEGYVATGTSTGLVTESEGRWDADRRPMTWKTLGLAPNTTGIVTDVIGADRIETTVLVKHDDGQVLVDGRATADRKK